MAIQFQKNTARNAPDPLAEENQGENKFSKAYNLPPGFMDPSDPFNPREQYDSKLSRKEKIVEIPEPELKWAKNEKNSFHRELFLELEDTCKKIHPNLTFWEEDFEEAGKEPIYSKVQAEWIIQDSEELNEEQKKAVLSCTDDLILNALAGTGKTRSLSTMIAYLLALGVKPNKIGVSSHTVTAAQEIKGRVEPTILSIFPKINDYRGKNTYNWIQAGTIHALAYRELGRMRHPKSRNAIIEESTQFKIWREACQFSRAGNFQDENESLLYEWMHLHDRIRGMTLPENTIPKVLKSITGTDQILKIAETYRKIKEARDLIDYTDLLRLWCEILVHPGYAKRWKYFFVDEYQDTSPLQKFILKILRYHGTKVIVCGDIRQSITSFAGSDPVIFNPLETLPGPTKAQELWLQVNYRCSLEIVSLANEVLRNMFPEEKHQLMARHDAPVGKTPKIIQIPEKNDKFRITVAEGMEMIKEFAQNGKDKASVALLYRTNAEGSKFEETIAEINSSRIRRGEKPITYIRKDYRKTALKTKTEREISTILHAWYNPQKARWFEILTSPYFRGIGEVTANTITNKAARKKPKEVADVWELFEGEIPRKSLETVGRFLAAWERSTEGLDEENLNTLKTGTAVEELQRWISDILESRSNFQSETISKKEIEESQRRSYEAGFFDKIMKFSEEPLKEALKKLEDESRKEEENEGHELPGGLVLSTIHLAKGKEFDGVVIHNLSWFNIPHYNATKQEKLRHGTHMLERRWRKLCSTKPKEEKGTCLLEQAIDNPETTLPEIQPYPEKSLWGKSEKELENEKETYSNASTDLSVECDWMTNPIEEEKRLLYVGITRAKEKLVITTSSEKSHPFIPAKTWWKLVRNKSVANENFRAKPPIIYDPF